MTESKINDTTKLPHKLSLGDVLNGIELAPGEVSALLTHFADQFRGSAHPNLARAFTDHAALVGDPRNYGYKTPEQPAAPDEQTYQPPQPGQVKYGVPTVTVGEPAVTPRSALYPNMQTPPAAQGQSTTPETVSTPVGGPSQAQPTHESDPTRYVPPASPPPPPSNEPQWMAEARAAGWNPGSQSPAPTESNPEPQNTPAGWSPASAEPLG